MAGEAPGVVTSAPVVPAADAAPDIVSTADALTEAPEGGEQPEATPEKTLTQSEVNKLIAKEKAKESRRVERAIRAEVERDLLRQQLEQRDRPEAATRAWRAPGQGFSDYERFPGCEAMYRMRAKRRKIAATQQQTAQHSSASRSQAQLAQTLNDNSKPSRRGIPTSRSRAAAMCRSPSPWCITSRNRRLGGRWPITSPPTRKKPHASRLHPCGQFRDAREAGNQDHGSSEAHPTPAPIVPNRGNSSGIKPLLDTNQDEFEERRRAFIAKKRVPEIASS
jgi:hypothetical protein